MSREGIMLDDSDTREERIEMTDVNNIDSSQSNEPWNYKIMLLLVKIGKKTMGYRWMHDQEAQYNERMNTKFKIVEAIILAFMAVFSSGQFVNFIVSTNLEKQKIFYVVMNVLQLVFIFITYIIKGYCDVNKFEKNTSDHRYTSTKNSEINLDIQQQLSLSIKDRETDNQFLRNVIKRFNDVSFLAPPIRTVTKNNFLKESNDNDIFNPIIANHDGENLQIMINDNQDNNNEPDLQMKYQIDRWLQHF